MLKYPRSKLLNRKQEFNFAFRIKACTDLERGFENNKISLGSPPPHTNRTIPQKTPPAPLKIFWINAKEATLVTDINTDGNIYRIIWLEYVDRGHNHGSTFQEMAAMECVRRLVVRQGSLWNVALIQLVVVVWVKQHHTFLSTDL